MVVFEGVVIRGAQRAAALGFPTVNIACMDAGLSGIYAARVQLDGHEYIAAAFYDATRSLLEAHLIGGVGDMYGKVARIVLYRKVRAYQSFESDDELRAAIASDVAAVRAYFADL